MAFVLIPACLGLGLCYQGARAATGTTANVDGYKINTALSRSGTFSLANVIIKKVTTGAINSSTANPFYLNALSATSAGDHYVVSISPTSVTGYAVKGLTWCLNACVGYNELTTNYRAGTSADFTFYAGNNYHMRWIFQPVAIPIPLAAPVKTPIPAAVSVSSSPTPLPNQSPVPVGTPIDFTATSLGSHAVVSLQWKAASGTVKNYIIERSIDQVAWQVIASVATDTQYTDENAGFGIHYYYRLKAMGADGLAGTSVTADARTPEFAANTDSSRDVTLTSNDQVVDVTLSAGSISDQADCSVSDSSDAVSITNGQSKVAGPYQLFCKTRLGETINVFAKPVSWNYHLKGHMGSGLVPKGYRLVSGGKIQAVADASYDKTTQDFRFTTSDAGQTLVLASSGPVSLMALAMIGLVILFVFLGIGILFFVRFPVKQTYEEYIRSKYYDL
jgi:hypothetical protein